MYSVYLCKFHLIFTASLSLVYTGEQQLRMPLEGGVLKRHPSSPARTAFKSTLAKSGPLKADGIVAQLKSLLPNAKHQKETSEVSTIVTARYEHEKYASLCMDACL